MKRCRSVGRMGLICWFVLCGCFMGCDDQTERFKVPVEYSKRKPQVGGLFRVLSKAPIPKNQQLPLWTEMVDRENSIVFNTEIVRLQGVRWSREGSGRVFDFYFQTENHMPARTLVQVGDRLAFFVSRWFGRPFSERIPVILMPTKSASTVTHTTSTQQPPAARPTPAPTSRAARPISRPTSAPHIAATSKPALARRTPAPSATNSSKRVWVVPSVGRSQIVIYTGTTNDPSYSRYGLISELLDCSVRIMMAGTATRKPADFWRSIAIPEYFAYRGISAMNDRSYDLTAKTLFRGFLLHAGRPTVQDVLRSVDAYQKRALPSLLEDQTRQVAESMLAFLEDGYGRGVLAAVLREFSKSSKSSFGDVLKRIIGRDEKELWSQWFQYYYFDQWLEVLAGRAPLQSIPAPESSTPPKSR